MTKFTEGERVGCYDLDGSMVCGTIHRNTDHPDVSDWYIKYDDGHECAVLDIEQVHKLNNYSMTNPKTITASLDEIVEKVMAAIFKPAKNQMGREFQLLQKHNIRTALEGLVVKEKTYTEQEVQAMFDPIRESYNRQVKEIEDLRIKLDFWVKSWNRIVERLHEVDKQLPPTPTEKGGEG